MRFERRARMAAGPRNRERCLLDAGAGDRWRYPRNQTTGLSFARLRGGLPFAELHMFFAAGAFFPPIPIGPVAGSTAARFATIDAAKLAQHFQVAPANPLVGLDETRRAPPCRRLGKALRGAHGFVRAAKTRAPWQFGRPVFLANVSEPAAILRRRLLATLLESLLHDLARAPLMVHGYAIGATARPPSCRRRTPNDPEGIVPFHKLSQWLAYSLIEPLEAAGIAVDGLGEPHRASPIYRNGGLPRRPRRSSARSRSPIDSAAVRQQGGVRS